MTTETLITFLGWCSVINIGLLAFTTVSVVVFRKAIIRIHSKMFAMKEEELNRAYFNYLALFKIAVIVLNIVPWAVLKIMS